MSEEHGRYDKRALRLSSKVDLGRINAAGNLLEFTELLVDDLVTKVDNVIELCLIDVRREVDGSASFVVVVVNFTPFSG